MLIGTDEMQRAQAWIERYASRNAAEVPFSFVCDGRPHGDVLKRSARTWSSRTIDAERTESATEWTNSDTGLAVRLVAVQYRSFPVVEWTVHLRNDGGADTPVIEAVQAIDALLELGTKDACTLHSLTGDYCTADGYEPRQTPLRPGASRSFAPVGGRGSNREFPYCNIQTPSGGVIIAIGWPGQWAASFARDEHGLHVRAGQEVTHLRLHPGESIRTPLIAMLFWSADAGDEPSARLRSQNIWRRWMMAHNTPQPGGSLPLHFMPGNTSGQFGEMIGANEENQKYFIDRYREEGIRIDYWWMDAGWYKCMDGPGPWHWPKTGTWEVDTNRFPRGLRAISDHAHAQGIKVIVWFEPERVARNTWLADNHPEWLLDVAEEPPLQDAHVRVPSEWTGSRLLDLGNPAARQWLTDHVSRLITEQGIDLYRQDFNFDPLPFWQANDAPDRQGIAENHHVTGYLAFWDELLRRHPDLLIDTCASGGRRNDLETLRRSVPLHKTDYNYADLPVKQAFHHSLFSWIPFFGAPVVPNQRVDTYTFRSATCPCTVIGFDMRRGDLDYALLRKLTQQWREIAGYYFSDYYPLLPYSREDHTWLAWQFHREQDGSGIVQVFRRAGSAYEAARLRLHALDPQAYYRFEDMDEQRSWEISGRELLDDGLAVTLNSRPQAAICRYTRIAGGADEAAR